MPFSSRIVRLIAGLSAAGCSHTPTEAELCNESAAQYCERVVSCGEQIDLWGTRFSGLTRVLENNRDECERVFNQRNCGAAPAVPSATCLDVIDGAQCLSRAREKAPNPAACNVNAQACRIDAISAEVPRQCAFIPVTFDWERDGNLWVSGR